MYNSTKVVEGFSTTFRQWKATHSHCQYLHGYALKFKITFEAKNLDDCNWVMDFGFSKRLNISGEKRTIKEWFDDMFDHTTVVASDDPNLSVFDSLRKLKLIQLKIVRKVGCESFAELVFEILNKTIVHETNGRVWIKSVECFETNNNSAIYSI